MERAEKRKTLIYGGAFNPPTVAHEALITECLKMPDFEDVWLMPCGIRRDKMNLGISDDDRLAMLKLVKKEVFAGNPRLVISDFELKLPRPTNTYSTIGALAIAYPSIEFWYAFGADAYADMPSWHHGLELQSSLNLVIFNRNRTKIEQRVGINVIKLQGYDDISSTLVRDASKTGGDISKYVCSSVAEYIKQRHLYK